MKRLKDRYTNFLIKFAQEEMDVVVIFFGLLLLLSSSVIAFECISRDNFWLSFFGVFVLPILTMIFLCVSVFPLVFIYKEVRLENEYNRIIVECLKQIGTLKDAMEFNQVYHLSKGYSACRTDLRKAETLLQKALGSEYKVKIECHNELSQYRIELVKYPELIAASVGDKKNLLIET